MDLTPTNAQKDISESVAEYLNSELPLGKLRSAIGSTPLIDDGTWQQWASMGFFSLGIPEESGGVGLGIIEEFLVFNQLGRSLVPGPVASTVLAAHIADQTGQRRLLKQLLHGSERVGLRVGDTGFDAVNGDLVLALTADKAVLERVTSTEPAPSIDPTVAVSRIEVGEQVACVAGSDLQTRFWIISAAALLGVAQAAEQQSTAYAKTRRQFDKPIGSFQAVKHRCADMVTRCYVAQSQLHVAGLAVSNEHSDGRFQAAAALVLALEAARRNTSINIQNHGGIAFTEEHDAGLYLKRAISLEASLGSPAEWDTVLLEPTRTVFA